ncbi:MAG TPA: YvcK family protein [Epulopiscium sp.]|nr:YvcK family protein [Candidatus Epulonipiscium sp.]
MYNPNDPKIVALGGGTGLSTMLRGLKKWTQNITAIVTVSDNGGNSGLLREEMNMLPPGDIRNCLVALANTEPTMEKLLQYRFKEGVLAGQNFGNLFLAALSEISGSFEEAVRVSEKVLAITGRVVPVTLERVNLKADFDDKTQVIGEIQIVAYAKKTRAKIIDIVLEPANPDPTPDAIEAIENADAIILGPGSLYTSIIPNLLVHDISKAISKAKKPVIYISNIMTQPGETVGFGVYDHIRELEHYLGKGVINTVIINSQEIPKDWLAMYLEDGADMIGFEPLAFKDDTIQIIKAPVMKINEKKKVIRHDSEKLAKIIMDLIQTN